MKVLAVNCGSSSLKFRLSETPPEPSGREDWSAWGVVDGVGGREEVMNWLNRRSGLLGVSGISRGGNSQ